MLNLKKEKIILAKSKKKIKIKEAISFLDSTSFNYAHWTVEILPKIYLFSKFNKNKKIILLVDKNLHKNQYQALNLIINKNHIVRYVDKNECIHVEKLHIISSVGYSYHSPLHPEKKHFHGIYSHSLLKDFSNYIIKNINSKSKNKEFEKIFITRQNKKRNLINLNYLIKILKSKKFKIVDINKINFLEQVQVFNKSKVIVSVNGASNSNIIFSKPKTNFFIIVNNLKYGDGYYFWPSIISFKKIVINYIVGKNYGIINNQHADFIIENFKLSKMFKSIKRLNNEII